MLALGIDVGCRHYILLVDVGVGVGIMHECGCGH